MDVEVVYILKRKMVTMMVLDRRPGADQWIRGRRHVLDVGDKTVLFTFAVQATLCRTILELMVGWIVEGLPPIRERRGSGHPKGRSDLVAVR